MMGFWRQHPNASEHWTSDWTDQLASIGRTLTEGDATTTTPGVTVDDVTHTTTTVVFRLATDGSLPNGSYAKINVAVTMDNGDTDEEDVLIQITSNA